MTCISQVMMLGIFQQDYSKSKNEKWREQKSKLVKIENTRHPHRTIQQERQREKAHERT